MGGRGEKRRERDTESTGDTLYTVVEESRRSVAVELKPIEKTSLVF